MKTTGLLYIMFQRLLRLSKRSVMILAFSLALVACTTPMLSTATAFPRTTLPVSPTSEPITTSILTLNPTNTPGITPIPVPTLTGEQRDRFLEDMLETNGGCELPCWWGGTIVPGKTTLGEAKRFFRSQGISYLVRADVVDVVFQVPHTIAMESWEYNAVVTITGQDELDLSTKSC